MKRGSVKGLVSGCSLALGVSLSYADIVINEFVVDPQRDWNNSGSITPSDEWFEILNRGTEPFNMYGIEIHFIDTTPCGRSLTDWGILAPGERRVLINPEGEQNNNGRIDLFDVVTNRILDSVCYGNWEGNVYGIPDGNAHGLFDESLSRFPESGSDFVKWYASYGEPNIPTPSAGLIGALGTGILLSSRAKRKR